MRVVEEDDLPLVRQVLQAQEYWRLKGLSADVVILNEHPVSYLDEMHEQLAALLDTGPWGAWKHRPGGVFLLRGDGMSEAERILLRGRRARHAQRRAGRAREPARPALRRAAVASANCRRAPPDAASPERDGAVIESPALDARATDSAASPTTAASTRSCSRATRRRRCPG